MLNSVHPYTIRSAIESEPLCNRGSHIGVPYAIREAQRAGLLREPRHQVAINAPSSLYREPIKSSHELSEQCQLIAPIVTMIITHPASNHP